MLASDRKLAKLESAYARMESRYKISDGSPSLAEAVSFQPNSRMPVHRWFNFKEGYSAGILSAARVNVKGCLNDGSALLDPFCGSGTTLLAADLQHQWLVPRIGIEVNPFLVFVADTKLGWRNYSPKRALSLARAVTKAPLRPNIGRSQWPELSSLRRSDLISPRRVSAIIDLSKRILSTRSPEAPLLLLALASVIESASYFRKDGRALRILRSDNELRSRRALSVASLFCEATEAFVSDIVHLKQQNINEGPPAQIINGDARKAHTYAELGSIGLAFYSPPYLNQIDYTEVYKIESSMLGFVSTTSDMLVQRKRTFRSHASVGLGRFEFTVPEAMATSFEIAVELISTTGWAWHSRVRRLVLAYCMDIFAALKAQYDVLKPGGLSVCVVGNSAHGFAGFRIPIATDLFIANIAESVGFGVDKMLVARYLSRRNQHRLMRESVIVLRK